MILAEETGYEKLNITQDGSLAENSPFSDVKFMKLRTFRGNKLRFQRPNPCPPYVIYGRYVTIQHLFYNNI